MASKKLITFYVAHVVEPIRKRLNELNVKEFSYLIKVCRVFRWFCSINEKVTDFNNQDIDKLLKEGVEIDKSKIEMCNEELINLCRYGFQFGDGIGLTLDFPKGELDDMLNFKDLK